ncbi:hypothetical protein IQ268_28135 [Oculatella sp. LEGE 06141]|nr:hypothetical protein [Oculatella sp. LEGE 06141]
MALSLVAAPILSPRAFALPHLVVAQQTQDISGWNNTQWGMTYEEIRALYPVGILQPNHGTSDFANHTLFDGFALGESRYRVEFHFGRSGTLESAILRWDQSGASPSQELLNALIAKYGQPGDNSIPSVGMARKVWNLPSTKISLIIVNRPDGQSVNLAYRRQTIMNSI